jgi:hypothetical protein
MAFASDKGRQGAAGVSTGYSIDNSLRFNDDDSAYLSRTPSSAGNRKTWTWSGWVKRGNLGSYHNIVGAGTGGADRTILFFWGVTSGEDSLTFFFSNGTTYGHQTNAIFRDVSAWYHITLAVDTTQATSTDRVKIYVNGEQVSTTPYGSGYVPQNTDLQVNDTKAHALGRNSYGSGDPFDGYLAEVNFVDGQALTSADFGETDATYGHWKPIKYTGTYGTNGFYLDFKNSGSLGTDASSNSNNWTPNNLAATDQMLDSPTNNFCTLNPLNKNADVTLSEGNLKLATTLSNRGVSSTYTRDSSKFYFEVVRTNAGGVPSFGVASPSWNLTYVGVAAGGGTGLHSNGIIYKDGAQVQTGLTSVVNGDIVGVACDFDADSVSFYINNTQVGTTVTGVTGEYTPAISGQASTNLVANFGQDSSFAGNKTAQGNADGNGYGDFYYAPPTGYLALCTQNLPEPTVVPSEHFNTGLWTGNSGSQTAVSSWGFQADLLWTKVRSHVDSHIIRDIVRDGSTTMDASIRSNSTAAEYTSSGTLTTNSTGFSVSGHDGGEFNYNTYTYATWGWKANGTGVSNTNGTITSTVSANADAGFSIVSYTGNGATGATVAHGLSSALQFYIIKNRDAGFSWTGYHEALGAGNYIQLDSSGAASSTSDWNSTAPTSSVFTVSGDEGRINKNGTDYIAYCFHSVEGYSKVGSYTGNGSADGTFVHCGFRPAYVMLKRTSSSGSHWCVFDSSRSLENPVEEVLFPSGSDAENNTYFDVDFVSNGIKFVTSDSWVNENTSTYIYLAFAEHPFKYTNAR